MQTLAEPWEGKDAFYLELKTASVTQSRLGTGSDQEMDKQAMNPREKMRDKVKVRSGVQSPAQGKQGRAEAWKVTLSIFSQEKANRPSWATILMHSWGTSYSLESLLLILGQASLSDLGNSALCCGLFKTHLYSRLKWGHNGSRAKEKTVSKQKVNRCG